MKFLKDNKIFRLNVVVLTEDPELVTEISDFFQHLLFNFIPVIDKFSDSEESYYTDESVEDEDGWINPLPPTPPGCFSHIGQI